MRFDSELRCSFTLKLITVIFSYQGLQLLKWNSFYLTTLYSFSVSFSFFLFHSGLVVPATRRNETVPEVVTTSGYALLHFFSDAAYNLTGFNIAYSYVHTSRLFHSFPRLFSLSLLVYLSVPVSGYSKYTQTCRYVRMDHLEALQKLRNTF